MAKASAVAKAAVALANPTAATCFKRVDAPTVNATVALPAGAQMFRIRAKGTATGGTTVNFTPVIQIGSAAAASNTALITGGAAAYNSANGCWFLEATCACDLVNKTVGGVGTGINASAGTIVSLVVATKKTAFDANVSGNLFSVSGLFSTSDAGNVATLDHFAIEVLA